jgi:hypothetical protein
MHNRTLLTALATAFAVAVAAPSVSQAQDTTTKKTSAGEVALKPNFGSLISALNAASAQNDKLKAMTEINASNVTLVNVEDLLKDNSADEFQAALKKNEADIATLRTTLGANTALTSVLTANAVPLTAADVVATDVGADGKVTLYYWKKPA